METTKVSSKEMAETRKGSLTDVGQSELRRHALDEIPHFRWGGLCTKDVQEVCNQTGDMWGGHRRSGDGVSSAAGPGGGNVRSGGKDGDGWSIVRVPRHAIGDICCANGNCPGGVGRAGVASILIGITLEIVQHQACIRNRHDSLQQRQCSGYRRKSTVITVSCRFGQKAENIPSRLRRPVSGS